MAGLVFVERSWSLGVRLFMLVKYFSVSSAGNIFWLSAFIFASQSD